VGRADTSHEDLARVSRWEPIRFLDDSELLRQLKDVTIDEMARGFDGRE
jgi:hypothetical protein